MKYWKRGRWVDGTPCERPVEEIQAMGLGEIREERHEDAPECHRDACGEFCHEFCCRFCPEFAREFCCKVRERTEEKHEKKRRGCFGFCGHKRPRLESCRTIACRVCQRVFREMGRVCPSDFCVCFAQDFCREFCREFECVRRKLDECHHRRREICHEASEEICRRVCPIACRENCCRVPII